MYMPVPQYPFATRTSPIPLAQLDQDFTYVSGKVLSVKDYGAVGDGVADDTAAIQEAINAAARGGLYFPPGAYKITSQINILTTLRIHAHPTTATIYLATPNQNGFVVGDGTIGGHNNTFNTIIDGLLFVPLAGAGNWNSGSVIATDFVSYLTIRNCSFYGANAGGNRFFNAISLHKGIYWNIVNCNIQRFRNDGIRLTGDNAFSNIGGRLDFCNFADLGNDCIFCGDYTAAITITSPEMHSFSGWGIQVDCTPAAGVGFNYLIFQPDIEASTTTVALGGTYFKRCAGAQIVGGWYGGTVGVKVETTASSIQMIGVLQQALVPFTINGPACTLTGCDVTGDNATTTVGIAVGALAADTNIVGGRVRQYTTAGISFTGTPTRCIVTGVGFTSNALNISNAPSTINNPAAPVRDTTPTPTSGTGAFTTVSAQVTTTKDDNRCKYDGTVTITLNGTAATDIRVPMPFSPLETTALSGVVVETGKAVTGFIDATAGGRAVIFLYDGTYPGADNRTIRFGGNYRVN